MTTTAQERIYKNGRPTTGWQRGEEITEPDQVKLGDMLIGVSHRFSAENLYIVVLPEGFKKFDDRFYVQYADVDGKPIGELGNLRQTSCVWDKELASDHNQWFRAERV